MIFSYSGRAASGLEDPYSVVRRRKCGRRGWITCHRWAG